MEIWFAIGFAMMLVLGCVWTTIWVMLAWMLVGRK